MPKRPNSAVELLSQALKFMVSHKFIKKAYTDHHRGYCALGALRAQERLESDFYWDAEKHLTMAAPIQSATWNPERGDLANVVEYNDLPTTKKKDIIRLFQRAIHAAETDA